MISNMKAMNISQVRAGVQKRGFATGKQIKNRMRSVKNIGKITKAMKMVAAAKLRVVQASLTAARSFATDIQEFWKGPETLPEGKKAIYALFTTDRGLCGAINGQVIRDAKARMTSAKDQNVGLFVVGDKGKAALERLYSKRFLETISDVGKGAPSFRQVSAIAERLIAQPFDVAMMTYNKFLSAISFKLTTVPLHSYETMLNDPVFDKFEFEGDKEDLLKNFYELRTAAMVYNFMVDSATSEESARMTAMDNSSKNAGEMLERLTLQFNKSRQSKITTELNEIISGATSIQQVAE